MRRGSRTTDSEQEQETFELIESCAPIAKLDVLTKAEIHSDSARKPDRENVANAGGDDTGHFVYPPPKTLDDGPAYAAQSHTQPAQNQVRNREYLSTSAHDLSKMFVGGRLTRAARRTYSTSSMKAIDGKSRARRAGASSELRSPRWTYIKSGAASA